MHRVCLVTVALLHGMWTINSSLAQTNARVVVSSKTHPTIYCDFERDFGTWSQRPDSGYAGARLSLTGNAFQGKYCLRLYHPVGGGDFAVNALTMPIDVRRYQMLQFAYLISPQSRVRVNMFLRINRRYYALLMTGPHELRHDAILLGDLNIIADGKWHVVRFPLLDALEQLRIESKELRLDEITIGNWSNVGYLLAGFGGNPAGAEYFIDDFRLYSSGGTKAEFTLQIANAPVGVRGAKSSMQAVGYSYVVDRNPLTEPDDAIDIKPPRNAFNGKCQLTLPPLAHGWWYLHVRAKMADAQWTPTAHYAFHVDTKPPQPTNVVPRNGARWGGSTLRIAFDEDGSGINLKSVVMKIGTHVFQWGHKALRFDASRNELALNLQSVGVTLRDGELVRCKLLPLSDRAGNVSKPLEWHWRMSYRLDKQPPCAPIIKWSGPQPLGGGGFEMPEQCWESYGQDVVIKRVQYQPASGQYCLMMQCIKDGGAFGAYIHRQPFDARQYPIIAFDYRISKHLRADFVLSHSGNLRSIHFADNDNPFIPLGSVTDVQRDERWHHAEIPLLKWVSNSALNPPMRINWLTIQDMGWRGNAEGETAYFDNFVLVPLTSSARGLEFRWMATDVSGISASAYRIDHHPNTNPSTKRKIQATHVRIAKPISGDFYLHVKVRDGAGNWSAPSHFRFLADGQPPRLQLIKPKLNARGAPSEVVMKLTDDFIGVDVAQMRIRIGKRLFDITSQAVVYDRERGELRWRHLCTSTAPAWADGMRIEGVVENVRDYAGNAVRKPLQFAFIVDYQYDDEPPEVIVESPTHAVLLWQDFERNIPWRSTGGVKIVKDGSTSAGGQCSVRITNAQDGGNMNVIVCDEPFDARMYPILRFDYRIPPGVRLDFVVRTASGVEWNVQLTDEERQTLGRIANVQADGNWHSASVDLYRILRRDPRMRALQRYEVTEIRLCDRSGGDNKRGATAWFDNVMILKASKRTPILRWFAVDGTGIRAYVIGIDDDANGEPTEHIPATQTQRTIKGLKRGIWFFHIRAQDVVGNVSRTVHYPIFIP